MALSTRRMVGTNAPAFSMPGLFGQLVDLQQLAGKPILLSFLRNGGCALCNVQVHRLIQHYARWHAQELEIIVVFESPRESLIEHVSKQDAPFAIIPDPEAQLYALYGVETNPAKISRTLTAKQEQLVAEAAAIGYALQHEAGSNFFRLPADFLINRNLVIERTLYSEAVGDHFSVAEIDQFLIDQVISAVKTS